MIVAFPDQSLRSTHKTDKKTYEPHVQLALWWRWGGMDIGKMK